jgi:hypothetical protein
MFSLHGSRLFATAFTRISKELNSAHTATSSLRFILITRDYINTGTPSGPFFLAITKKKSVHELIISLASRSSYSALCNVIMVPNLSGEEYKSYYYPHNVLLAVSVQMTHSASCSQTPSICALPFVPDPYQTRGKTGLLLSNR